VHGKQQKSDQLKTTILHFNAEKAEKRGKYMRIKTRAIALFGFDKTQFSCLVDELDPCTGIELLPHVVHVLFNSSLGNVNFVCDFFVP
jgi:hypothetical protein